MVRGQAEAITELVGLLDEAELWSRRDEPAVRRELAKRFLPFAKSIAIRYQSKAESLEDLVQIASLGLMNAIDRFDPAKGSPFLAFASPTIDGELKRHFRDRVAPIRLPRGLYERIGQIETVASRLRAELRREPSDAQVAEATGCSVEQVQQAREAPQVRHPLTFSRGGEEDETPIEEHLGREDDGYARVEDGLLARDALRDLDGEEREIVILRFRDDLSQSQIADRIGCSQMQISRRLRRIIDSLNRRLTSAGPGGIRQREGITSS